MKFLKIGLVSVVLSLSMILPYQTTEASIPMCKSDVMNMAMKMADEMFGMASKVPVFGRFMSSARRRVMDTAFDEVLKHTSLTLDFMRCALHNKTIVKMMLRALKYSPGLIDDMGMMARYEPKFNPLFVLLATRSHSVSEYIFNNINPMIYDHLTYDMIENPELTEEFTKLFISGSAYHLTHNKRFVEFLFDFDDPSNNDDAIERATERFIYSVFGNFNAGNMLVDSLSNLDSGPYNILMDLLFFGEQRTSNYSIEKAEVLNTQRFYNTYAMVDVLAEKIIPHFDNTVGMDPISSNLANALVAKLMGHLINSTGLTVYGQSFFQAMISMAQVHHNKNAYIVIGFFEKIFPSEAFEQAPAALEQAPAPRDYKTRNGNIKLGNHWFPPSLRRLLDSLL